LSLNKGLSVQIGEVLRTTERTHLCSTLDLFINSLHFQLL